MGLFGNKKRLEEENENLKKEIMHYESLMTPELKQLDVLRKEIDVLSQEINTLTNTKDSLEQEIDTLENSVKSKKHELRDLDEDLLAEEFGLYTPHFDFSNSTYYKEALKTNRSKQKEEIKDLNKKADATNWSVNGSSAKGKKMVRETTRLLMRAYNSECDDLVRRVKTSNVEKYADDVYKLASTISKLGSTMGISIPLSYVSLKENEIRLAYEYAVEKEKEKEEIREAKAREREELKVKKEIEQKRKQLEKEKSQYEKALNDARSQLLKANNEDKEALQEKIAELEANLNEVQKGIESVDYREANIRAGYVYIISNIGSFGDNVYKIGMTRRLEPMDRIRELSDASVPFNFDVHALIFSDDAPGLEAALHREFDSRKLNLVNQRREFFKCSLDEIKEAIIKNYDKTVDFVDFPDAEQYRVSEKMRTSL